MIFDRDSNQANWMRLNKLSRELNLLKYTFSDNGLMSRHMAIALAEVESAKEILAAKIAENAEIEKIKKDFQ